MSDGRARLIRLVILGSCRLTREVLAAYFAGQAGCTVVGHTSTVDGLARLCVLASPDVAVVESEHCDLATVRALRDLRQRHPDIGVVVIYTSTAPEVTADPPEPGDIGLVPGSAGLDAMAHQVRCHARQRAVGAVDDRTLTERELAVASLISAGHTTDHIAELLHISAHTVDNHRRRIYTKLGVDNQSAAVAQVISLGIASASGRDHAGPVPRQTPGLTARERQVLGHIAEGHTTRQTARTLGIADKTVENTRARLYRKLGARNRGEALAVAYRLGLIEPTATH